MGALVVFSIGLSLLLGLSLLVFAAVRRKIVPVGSARALPPADWPDVPIASLGLFRREGRINQTVDRPFPPPPRRLETFEETQDFVRQWIGTGHSGPGRITLRLATLDGPAWTEVLVDGCVIAQLPTAALTRRSEVLAA